MQNGTLGEKEKDLVAMSKEEFAKRRKILVTNLPDAVDLEVSRVNKFIYFFFGPAKFLFLFPLFLKRP